MQACNPRLFDDILHNSVSTSNSLLAPRIACPVLTLMTNNCPALGPSLQQKNALLWLRMEQWMCASRDGTLQRWIHQSSSWLWERWHYFRPGDRPKDLHSPPCWNQKPGTQGLHHKSAVNNSMKPNDDLALYIAAPSKCTLQTLRVSF